MHAFDQANDGGGYGPYAHHYYYDPFGNITQRLGWGGANPSYTASYANNEVVSRVVEIFFSASLLIVAFISR